MLTTLDSCEQKFFNEYILKLSPLAISPDLHAGGAFSHGIEVVRHSVWVNGLDIDSALLQGTRAMMEYWGMFEPPHNHPKTCEAMIGALYYYFKEAFPIETDIIKPFLYAGGMPAIEFSFSIPMEVSHPVTGDPILFGGRADLIGVYDNALTCIVDEKTTKRLGDHWQKQWDLRGQFLGYTYAAKQHNIPVDLSVIRGIAILKYDYSHLEVIEQYPNWLVEQWWHEANKKVARAKQRFLDRDWGYSFGEACTSYSGCVFTKMCLTKDKSTMYSEYQERNWNPLRKNPTLPDGGMKAVEAQYENLGNIHDLMADEGLGG